MSSQGSEPAEELSPRKLARQTILSLVAMLAVAAICGLTLRGPIESASRVFVERLGLPGLFLGTLISDSSLLPLTNEPLMMLGIGGGMAIQTVFWTTASASVLAGLVGYGGGRLVGRTRVKNFVRKRAPGFALFMERHGVWGVALAALLPIPFSFSTWSAGVLSVPLWKVAAASLLRIPKTAFYLWLLAGSWQIGA